MKNLCIVALIAGLSLHASPSWAHKIKCFAAADGEQVSGYAWMSGGARPQHVAFRVLAPDGAILHEGTTNERGEFSFVPDRACDHRIVIEAGDGHVAEFTVRADELPGAARDDRSVASPAAKATPTPVDPSALPAVAPDLEALVDRAVSRQITPLRRDLAEFQERARLQDVLAGLGYIAGLTGAAFFFLGLRRKDRYHRSEP